MGYHNLYKSALAPLFVAACLVDFSGAAIADDDAASAFAQACEIADGEVYTVKGKINTINASPTTQIGTINLTLLEDGDEAEFKEKGNLVGTITGGAMGATILSHSARFPKDEEASDFVTTGDLAIITGIRAVDDQGMPCSFFIHETITEISSGSGFFSNVLSVDIKADGHIAFCPTENKNKFKLSGEICIDD